ncbi:ribonuclease H-like YkuK family protein [Patescibacteria group bacterium]|nr:ribonuclease H-like YkuK family protein [Patescibacteria group bacterium]
MFVSPTTGKLPQPQLIDSVADFIEEKPDWPYRLIIGSDSHLRGKNGQTQLKLVTAIIIHRVGLGGRYFWQTYYLPETKTLRDKIYAETMKSLEIAHDFLPKMNKRLNGHGHYQLEIHIDVGRAGETREMIKEVVGIVTGNGFTAITKPDSYGASKVADKHT